MGISSRHYRIRRGFPVIRACTARLPRLLRSLAMTNLRVLPSCVIPRSEAPLALPLGELSPKVTERACGGGRRRPPFFLRVPEISVLPRGGGV